MQPYSMDLRQRVIDDCDAGLPTKQVAEKYQVSRAWVRRLKQQRRQRGDIQPRRGGHRPVRSTATAWPVWWPSSPMPPWPNCESDWS